jgi:hypothetical protein
VVKAEPNEVNITFSQALTMLRTGRKWVVIDSHLSWLSTGQILG